MAVKILVKPPGWGKTNLCLNLQKNLAEKGVKATTMWPPLYQDEPLDEVLFSLSLHFYTKAGLGKPSDFLEDWKEWEDILSAEMRMAKTLDSVFASGVTLIIIRDFNLYPTLVRDTLLNIVRYFSGISGKQWLIASNLPIAKESKDPPPFNCAESLKLAPEDETSFRWSGKLPEIWW